MVRSCACRKAEEKSRGREAYQPGRIHSKRPQRLPPDTGNGGNDPPSGPAPGRPTVYAWGALVRCRERLRAGDVAPPNPPRRCSTPHHRPFSRLLLTGDRRSARIPCQPELLPISASQNPTLSSARQTSADLLARTTSLRPKHPPSAWMK